MNESKEQIEQNMNGETHDGEGSLTCHLTVSVEVHQGCPDADFQQAQQRQERWNQNLGSSTATDENSDDAEECCSS